MYNDQLEESTAAIETIFLDPNNPRFWTEKTTRDVPDKKVPDDDVQARTQSNIEQHGVQELKDSILRNGFLPLDRIVVRPIEGHEGQYVVVEGNRRLAALRALRQQIDDELIDEDELNEEYLQNLKDETDNIQVLVYRGTDTADIAWLLQGIRHISGVRDWQPAQRARLVANQIEEQGLGFKQAGQKFGLTAQAVGRLYRSFKALEQMRQDDEFQTKARNNYFTLFEEAIRNKDVRMWLGWDEDKKQFLNVDNLRQFYSWIVPDDEREGKPRRVHDPRQLKELGYLIAGSHDELIAQIDQYEMSIGAIVERARQVGQKYDWMSALRKAGDLIDEVPSAASKTPEAITEILSALDTFTEKVKKVHRMISAATE